MTRPDLVKEARSWLSTPYHHMGRLKGVGVDCIGVVMALARYCGVEFDENTWVYNSFAEGVKLNAVMGEYLTIIPPPFAEAGDVLTFFYSRTEKYPRHCGVLTDYGLLHTHTKVGKVVEHTFSEGWKERVSAAFRFPGVV